MKKYIKSITILIISMILLLPIQIYAHPGRTDSKGGHTDKSTGQYHYHNNGNTNTTTTNNTNNNTTTNTQPTKTEEKPTTEFKDTENSDVATMKQSIIDMKAKIEEQEKQIKDLEEQKKKLISEKDDITKNLSQANVQIENFKKENEKLKASKPSNNNNSGVISGLFVICIVCWVIYYFIIKRK